MFELGNRHKTLTKHLDVPAGTVGAVISKLGLNPTLQKLPQNDCPSRLST